MRKALLLALFFFQSSQAALAAKGQIRSWDKREPQVINFYDNPGDNSKVIYEFCLASRSKDCVLLSPEEGVPKGILEKEARKYLRQEQIARFLGPLAAIGIPIAFIYMAIQTGGVSAVIMAAGGSLMISDEILSPENSPQFQENMAYFLNPNSNGMFPITVHDIHIVDLSYILEEKLQKLTSPIPEVDISAGDLILTP